MWESKGAFDKASEEVVAYYRRAGFDMPATLAQLGVKAEIGGFVPPFRLQYLVRAIRRSTGRTGRHGRPRWGVSIPRT